MTRETSKYNALAFIFGIISTLFVPTAFGRVSMLDLLTYFLGPIVLLIDYNKYSKTTRRVLLFSLLWLVGGIISDAWRGTDFQTALKANAIIFNAFTIFVSGVWVLNRSPKAFVWFIAGNAISSFISLYVFQNGGLLVQAVNRGYSGGGSLGVFLVDKMKYPIYIGLVVFTIIMPLRLKRLIPWFLCAIGIFSCGVYLLIECEGRSSCLIYAATAAMMLIYVYCPRLLKVVLKKKVLTISCLMAAAAVADYAYIGLARAGVLGESGLQKYESRKYGETSALDNRADLLINWPFLWRSPIFGADADMIDRWGYVEKSSYVEQVDVMGNYIPHYKFYGHSCIVGSWTQCGVLGLLFWAYALIVFYRFLGERVMFLYDFGPFVMFIIIQLMWHICFSPYGMFRGKVMFTLAYVALMMNPKYASWSEVAFASNRRIRSEV